MFDGHTGLTPITGGPPQCAAGVATCTVIYWQSVGNYSTDTLNLCTLISFYDPSAVRRAMEF